jgi:hypothetical protein
MGGVTKVVDDFVQTGNLPQSSGGGGDIFSDFSNAFTQVTQPLEKAVTAGVEDTSKNLTTVLQPVEKAASKATTELAQDPSKALTNALQPVEKTINYIGAHPDMQLALAMAVAVPVVGEYIGAELMAAGAVTSAEAASAAAIAQGATAAQAAAAAQAATATATVIGTAIASTSAQVAQGVPLEQAIQNTAADVAVSQLSPAAAKQLDGLLNSPAVTDAITSTVASGAATAARGGSQEEVEKAMTAGLAGSAASSAYKSVAKSAPDIYSKTIGGATAGAVKGGTEGAVVGGLSSAAASLGRPSTSTKLAADTSGGADLETYADPSTTTEIPPAPVAPLDVTQDQSQAETARLARQNEILKLTQTTGTPVYDYDPTTTPTVEKGPVYLGELPEVTITGTREKEYTPEITTPPKPIAAIPAADVTTPPTAGSNPTPLPSLAEPETPVEEAPADKPSTYKPDIFVTTYKKPKSGSYSSTATLGAALGTAGTTTGLTAERGAGEIEGTGSGKPRKKVWNEESLKLKDALGV